MYLPPVAGYHDALIAYHAGEPDRIILLTAEATFRAIDNGRQLAGDVTAARTRWQDSIKARKDATAWKIADLLARQPIVNARTRKAAGAVRLNNLAPNAGSGGSPVW